MESKRQRTDFNDFHDWCDFVDETVKKQIKSKVTELHRYVKTNLLDKKREIEETKTAFSAVARENINLVEGNRFLKSQLDDCFNLLADKDKQIDESKKLISELEEQNLLAEFVKNEEQINEQKNIIERLENDVSARKHEKIIIESENKVKEELLRKCEEQSKMKTKKVDEELNNKMRDIEFLGKEVHNQIKEKINTALKVKLRDTKHKIKEAKIDEMKKQMELVENMHKEEITQKNATIDEIDRKWQRSEEDNQNLQIRRIREFKENTEKLEYIETQKTELEKKLETLIKSNKAENSEQKLRIEGLDKFISQIKMDLKAKTDESSEQANNLESIVKEKDDKIGNLQNKINEMEDEIKEKNLGIVDLEIKLEQMIDVDDETTFLNYELSNQKTELDELTLKLSKNLEIIGNLQRNFDLQQNKFEKMKDEMKEKNARTVDLESKLEQIISIEDETIFLNTKLSEKQSEVDNLNLNLDGFEKLKAEYEQMENAIKEKNVRIIDLERKLVNYAELNTEKIRLTTINEKSEQIISELKKELEAKTEESCEQLKSVEGMVTEKEEIVRNLKEALDEQLTSAEVQNEQNAIYRQEYEYYRQKYETNLAALQKCTLENQNLQKYTEDVVGLVRAKEAEINSIKMVLNIKEEELATLANEVQESDKKFADYRREVQEQKS